MAERKKAAGAASGPGVSAAAAVSPITDDVTGEFYPVANDSIDGYGAELQVGDGATPEVFVSFAAVSKITPGAMNTADVKVTHLRSPDAHEEHKAGIRDSAAFSFEMVWLPTAPSQSNAGGGVAGPFTNGGLISFWRDRKNRNYQIKFSDAAGTLWPFSGYCNQFQPLEINNGDVVRASAGVQPSKAYDADLP